MLLQFFPHPSPPILSLPVATSRPRHPHPRLPPVRASPSPEPELLAKSALRRISDKLRSLGYLETSPETPIPSPAPSADAPSPGEIFVPTPAQLPRHRVGSTLDPSWSTGDGEADAARRRQRRGRDAAAAPTPPSAAELTLPRDELRRLQGVGIRLRKRLKVGKPGVTEGIVNGIHERWRNAELVKIRCDDISAMNMRRTHEVLERKTGGLVIWRSGSTIILYRGTNYKYPYFHDQQKMDDCLKDESSEQSSSDDDDDDDEDLGFLSVEQCSSEEDGRSSNLQGLAASMIKLWERCEVAKIAMKRGLCIDSELVSEELKGLTGGTLLSRDNESIVLYRGKDFLPPAVSLAIEKRRKHDNSMINKPKPEIEESIPTQDASELKMANDASVHGHECHEEKHEGETSVTDYRTESLNTVAQNMETRLSQAIAEKKKAEKLLEELEKASRPSKAETRETISEEERYMLRKVGLQMKPFLLLGRRGVFDGTIENMHLHWKYRELVKIMCKEHSMEDVTYAARTLEAESGGILVAVERVSKGHAIIMYRGKNYQRPSALRPKSLLNKKDALKRSVELQRHKSLKLHVLNLSKNIDYLRGQMQMEGHAVVSSDQMNSGHENKGIHDLCDNSGTLGETSKEVPEVAPKCFEPESEECSSGGTNRILNTTKSGVPLDDTQNKLCLNELIDDSSEASRPCLNENSSSASSDNQIEYQNRLSFPVECHSDSGSEEDSKVFKTLSPSQALDEPILDQTYTPHLPSKAAPLSNRERLVLRKQALQTKKRPVLAIGRNNVITGVAKTIRTHFKKHPLAIVNIKNRADGTPVQQLISELEEATGSVLVSREPNKVILYRGWGADVTQTSSREDGTNEGEKEVISPQLLEAIRLECGLHPGESQ
ncbi:hypothetical protein CFC21_017718 [Triticum aestivum]|uniref:CRM-domain containing factor CFM3, chloroplastic/mitochondrial n=3 Tax=Triticum TaxID=4564 RepID=A0A9R1R9F8_TRITD|nr:hypothetical protein CFC21_017718 [Triticum aestivum]VAH33178.1 unnamed protein product [Triticum turgidum subsp. durum]